MKRHYHPIRSTVVFGGLGAVANLLIRCAGLSHPLPGGAPPFCLIWMLVAGYSLLLIRWRKVSSARIVFPLLMLGLAGLTATRGTLGSILLALLVLSWVRTGICYRSPLTVGVLRETLLATGGALLAGLFSPAAPAAWAMAIWLFFLVQALFFIIFDGDDGARTQSWAAETPEDAFDKAHRCIDTLLNDLAAVEGPS
jgi:hypothetical protein